MTPPHTAAWRAAAFAPHTAAPRVAAFAPHTTARRAAAFAAVAVILAGPGPVRAQVAGTHLVEVQHGNLPRTDPAGLTTAFDQLSLRYEADRFDAGLRLEQFLTPEQAREWQRLSQYHLTLREARATVTVGHFYEQTGRGLLLRAFEIPGVVFEDAASRVRQGFYRDIQGVRLAWDAPSWSVRGVHGRPLVNVLAPTIPDRERRPELIDLLSAETRLGAASLGAHALRIGGAGGEDHLSLLAGLRPGAGFDLYGEWAQETGAGRPLFDGDRRAFYASVAFSGRAAGASLEFKDYHDYLLGAGINDPPSGIREHPYATLNRSTHVLNTLDERGWQLEAWLHLPGSRMLTLNGTRAVNRFGSEYMYRELFAELTSPFGDRSSVRAFVDWAEDGFRFERNRFSTGAFLEHRLSGDLSGTLDVEFQSFSRMLGARADVRNFVVALSLSRSTRYSLGLVWERSTDPFLADDPRTTGVETAARTWAGLQLGFRPNRRHTVGLFAGSRRGGPACTSGICYEVLDFRGMELRVTSRI